MIISHSLADARSVWEPRIVPSGAVLLRPALFVMLLVMAFVAEQLQILLVERDGGIVDILRREMYLVLPPLLHCRP